MIMIIIIIYKKFNNTTHHNVYNAVMIMPLLRVHSVHLTIVEHHQAVFIQFVFQFTTLSPL